jgi:hypothetical protein
VPEQTPWTEWSRVYANRFMALTKFVVQFRLRTLILAVAVSGVLLGTVLQWQRAKQWNAMRRALSLPYDDDFAMSLTHLDGTSQRDIDWIVLPLLSSQLESPYAVVRYRALVQLCHLGRRAKPVLAKVMLVLKTDDELNRELNHPAAIECIGSIGEPTPESIAAVVHAARAGEPRYARTTAVRAMGQLGPALLEPLLTFLRDDDPAVQCASLIALTELGEAATLTIPELQQLTLNSENDVRELAMDLLAKMCPAVTDAVY